MSETELINVEPLKKKVGRPKKIADMKEYQREYQKKKYDENKDTILERNKKNYEENKDTILERNKQYINNLKENDPEKYDKLRINNNEQTSKNHKRERDLLNLFKELYETGIITLPEPHKVKIERLLCS